MNHKSGYNELSKTDSHRKAMITNMVSSLFKHGRVQTTKAKAKAVQIRAERMITRAKIDSVHNRRIIARTLGGSPGNKAALAKLFTEIGPGYTARQGGYTRIIKVGYRQGDAAEMVLLELLNNEDGSSPAKKTGKRKAASGKALDKAPKAAVAEKAADKAAKPAPAPAETSEPAADKAAASDTAAADKATADKATADNAAANDTAVSDNAAAETQGAAVATLEEKPADA
jgi:large subunit ribosomal protein L17